LTECILENSINLYKSNIHKKKTPDFKHENKVGLMHQNIGFKINKKPFFFSKKYVFNKGMCLINSLSYFRIFKTSTKFAKASFVFFK
jgi:hypothetical protein